MKSKALILLVTFQVNANNIADYYNQILKTISDVLNTVVESSRQLMYMGGSSLSDEFGKLVVRGDFNGDNYDDIAVRSVGFNDTGAILVVYGSLLGLVPSNYTEILPDSSIQKSDGFGFSLAAGDFDGDGKDDLAVGIPFYYYSGVTAAGIIAIYEGSSSGLQTTSSTTIATGEGQSEKFGYSMVSGDYNGDGKDDLAVSSPYKAVNGVTSAGEVRVYNGTSLGLANTSLIIKQGANGVFGVPESGDLFGWSLASGDFNKDTSAAFFYDDLAIGVPFEDYHATNDGIVQVLTGSEFGLVYSRLWSQDDSSDETSEDDDMFGYTLATGNLNGIFPDDLADELIIGVPYEDIGAVIDAGVVHAFYGSITGLVATGNQVFSQETPGIYGSIEAGDQFGLSITTGNINPEGLFDIQDDLFIGVPLENFAATDDGVVHIILGSQTGADASNSILIANDHPENFSKFGNSLATLSASFYDGDQFSRSLIIGVPGYTLFDANSAGAIEEIKYINDNIFQDSFE